MPELPETSIAQIDLPVRAVPDERAILGVDAERLGVFDPASANQSTEPEDKG